MKKVSLLLAALILTGVRLAAAEDGAERLQIKAEMRGFQRIFQDLEGHLAKRPPDYQGLLKSLEEMEAHAKAIQSLKPPAHPGREFKTVLRDIEDFKKGARAKDASAVEDSMNRFSENCFRCHLSHKR